MRRHGRSRSAVLAVVVGLAGATALGAGWATIAVTAPPAVAQESLIESDPAVIKARADLEAAQQAAHDAAGKLEATTEQRDGVQNAIRDDQTHIAELDQQRAELAAIRDALLAHLRDRAVALYRAGGDAGGTADIFSGSALEGARRKQLGDVATRSDHENARKLESARTTLATTQAALHHEQDDLQQQQDSLDTLLVQLQQEQADVDQRVAAANAALERARVLGALHAAGEPIMGPAALTADQMVAWYNAQGYHPQLNGISVSELAQIFVEEGGDENVRGDFAFAQAIIETGGFASAPDNNYSGLGWCDSCARDGLPDAARRRPRTSPTVAQLRRHELPGREPAPPTVAVLVERRPECCGTRVRHVLRQGLGAHVERHGPRELGDRSRLLGQGHLRLPVDGRLRASPTDAQRALAHAHSISLGRSLLAGIPGSLTLTPAP